MTITEQPPATSRAETKVAAMLVLVPALFAPSCDGDDTTNYRQGNVAGADGRFPAEALAVPRTGANPRRPGASEVRD